MITTAPASVISATLTIGGCLSNQSTG
jgi:hypothetical protein